MTSDENFIQLDQEPSHEWVVRFLNLPVKEQIEFLHRYALQEEVRNRLEKKVLDKD